MLYGWFRVSPVWGLWLWKLSASLSLIIYLSPALPSSPLQPSLSGTRGLSPVCSNPTAALAAAVVVVLLRFLQRYGQEMEGWWNINVESWEVQWNPLGGSNQWEESTIPDSPPKMTPMKITEWWEYSAVNRWCEQYILTKIQRCTAALSSFIKVKCVLNE